MTGSPVRTAAPPLDDEGLAAPMMAAWPCSCRSPSFSGCRSSRVPSAPVGVRRRRPSTPAATSRRLAARPPASAGVRRPRGRRSPSRSRARRARSQAPTTAAPASLPGDRPRPCRATAASPSEADRRVPAMRAFASILLVLMTLSAWAAIPVLGGLLRAPWFTRARNASRAKPRENPRADATLPGGEDASGHVRPPCRRGARRRGRRGPVRRRARGRQAAFA